MIAFSPRFFQHCVGGYRTAKTKSMNFMPSVARSFEGRAVVGPPTMESLLSLTRSVPLSCSKRSRGTFRYLTDFKADGVLASRKTITSKLSTMLAHKKRGLAEARPLFLIHHVGGRMRASP